MRKVVIEKAGSYQALQIKEFPDPYPDKGEVLIRVRAAGVNFADCCVRMGVYQSAKEFVGWPITPGFEVAGVVEEIGEGVTHFSKGDKVIALTLFGGYTTHLVAKEENVLLLPTPLSFEEGAAIPAVFLTAYYGLFHLCHPRRGETILVHSAAGGVGSTLVQMGKLAGCRVIGVVGAPHKVDFVKSLGADEVIDKSQESLWEAVEALSPKGCDLVFDANGVETLEESYQHVRSGGKLIVYGFHTMFTKGRGRPNWFKLAWDYIRTPRFNPLQMTNENKSVMAFNLSYLFDERDLLMEGIKKITTWIEEGKLKAPPVTSYPLEEVAAAHLALESGATVGKLVLRNE